jgi:tetratricopeptide (TPR) repeat protein
LEIVRVLPWHRASVAPEVFEEQNRVGRQQLTQHAAGWAERLRTSAPTDPASAYFFVTLTCDYGFYLGDSAQAAEAEAWHADSPLLAYRKARCTPRGGDADSRLAGAHARLSAVLERVPAFVEIEYLLGEQALQRRAFTEAAERLLVAHAAMPAWPAVALLLGDVGLAAEDLEASLAFYDEVVSLEPRQREGLLGKAKALSYLGRSAEATQVLDALLALGTFHLGDGYYWRAWNENRLDRLDAAWADVERAKQYRSDSEVFKLGGIVALQREELELARTNLETAVARNRTDCDAAFYLGDTYVALRTWPPAGPIYAAAASCYESEAQALEREIRDLEASDTPPERKAAMVARRRSAIRTAVDQGATSLFNAAASYFNAGDTEAAGQYAERAQMDPRFADRAGEILERIGR